MATIDTVQRYARLDCDEPTKEHVRERDKGNLPTLGCGDTAPSAIRCLAELAQSVDNGELPQPVADVIEKHLAVQEETDDGQPD